ncbi:MAG: NAD(P)/FAD-dependent oxidoreductase [Myxococcales bacterium]|nr:NAD(P)/FAD-dependent oxidoreductase [Myxococcales bacterium]
MPSRRAQSPEGAPHQVDCLIIGAGFGGLGAAVGLLGRAERVVLCEAVRYPGGCASSFERGGQRYESGATLFSGLGAGQLFERWRRELQLDVVFEALDPVIELRGPGLVLPVWRSRERFIDALCALEPAHAISLRRFFAEQKRVADALWELFDSPSLLPPLSGAALWRHSLQSPAYVRLLPLLGQPLEKLLQRHRLTDCHALRVYLNAVCQITVQTDAASAEAPFALAAMDYCFRGTGHVVGGIGQLATAVCEALERRGVDVRFSCRVQSLRRSPHGGFEVQTRQGSYLARCVIANLLPQDLAALLGRQTRQLDDLSAAVETGWGAVMSYLRLEAAALPARAFHLELVGDTTQEFTRGNHVFCSVSDAREHAAGAPRSATLSTHVELSWLRSLDAGARARAIREIQGRLRQTLELRAPELASAVLGAMPASPRTFERFTGRFAGYVGGVPRRAGLSNYRRLGPLCLEPGLYLVGDSVFPGQSILAAALGGLRTAEAAVSSELGGSDSRGIGKRPDSAQHADPHVGPSARS